MHGILSKELNCIVADFGPCPMTACQACLQVYKDETCMGLADGTADGSLLSRSFRMCRGSRALVSELLSSGLDAGQAP